jgi:hypothetical protein
MTHPHKTQNPPTDGSGAALSGTRGSGYEALWCWFGMSRASFLIVPRVLMHEMPDGWQAKMATLLSEYDDAFMNWPDDFDGVRAQLTKNGKCVRTPEWMSNYRHPDTDTINALRPNGADEARR